ncbi:ribose 5-phosphate isomerase B (plasmid) [Entomospira entomophila]|uniref:Ribose 5-phosphate isomerase B n=1 Tax=Entomospira entomophila TaxID=2719988 RepID=A0A968GD63_9SPIO|nr:ribose 5-phosphate isomerase B [Entomospira entomophilus]NIZ41291.1 ribose 5-phosphate isomerase B [Entomospira entomophilus]WDI36183.1 ribose 5-phosphate isomerase B [Entomospira entomophilus]
MKIALGCDHIVTEIKDEVHQYLLSLGHEVIDCGTHDKERTHYPIYALKVAQHVANHSVERGIVICGTGVGISVSATKVKGTRVVLTRDAYTARMAREKYDANVLGMGGRIVGMGLMQEIIDTFLATKYTEKNTKFIQSIEQLETHKDVPQLEIFDEYLQRWEAGHYTDS